jgi:hypothetical protein
VQDHGAAFQVEQQVLRASTQFAQPLTRGFLRQLARHAPAQPRLTNQDRADHLSADRRLYAAARRFDFGKFGHRGT